jgi:CDP-diacylglycerol--serine O-phosphatidyltransferase
MPVSINNNDLPRGRGIYLLPNLFTIMALFAGFYAIVQAIKGYFDYAAIAIFVAMVMDALDGRVARLTNTQTTFGAELDSLSDMVSFGLAPALVLYMWSLDSLGKLGWLAAFVYAAAVALRLARFNVMGGNTDKRYFRGLPCPPAAGVIASVIWCGNKYAINGHTVSVLIAVIAVLLAFLMVSNLLYRSFKDLDLKGRVPFVSILVVVLILVLVALDPPEVLLVIFSLFALSGPFQWLWKHRYSRKARIAAIKEKANKEKNTNVE